MKEWTKKMWCIHRMENDSAIEEGTTSFAGK
jgi:hypothetical protein